MRNKIHLFNREKQEQVWCCHSFHFPLDFVDAAMFENSPITYKLLLAYELSHFAIVNHESHEFPVFHSTNLCYNGCKSAHN